MLTVNKKKGFHTTIDVDLKNLRILEPEEILRIIPPTHFTGRNQEAEKGDLPKIL